MGYQIQVYTWRQKPLTVSSQRTAFKTLLRRLLPSKHPHPAKQQDFPTVHCTCDYEEWFGSNSSCNSFCFHCAIQVDGHKVFSTDISTESVICDYLPQRLSLSCLLPRPSFSSFCKGLGTEVLNKYSDVICVKACTSCKVQSILFLWLFVSLDHEGGVQFRLNEIIQPSLLTCIKNMASWGFVCLWVFCLGVLLVTQIRNITQ